MSMRFDDLRYMIDDFYDNWKNPTGFKDGMVNEQPAKAIINGKVYDIRACRYGKDGRLYMEVEYPDIDEIISSGS